MDKVYIIPGIGADTRVFCKLALENLDIIRCDWIKPAITDDLVNYAQILVKQYDIQADSIIIGNSLGGMIAVEIAKQLPVKQLVLISSMKVSIESPAYFSFFRIFPLYRYLPVKVLLKAGLAFIKFFKLMPVQDAILFESMVDDSNDETMRWGMHAALNWDHAVITGSTIHINGEHDLVFPVKRIKDAIIIKKGTHLMVYDRAEEINQLLSKLLRS